MEPPVTMAMTSVFRPRLLSRVAPRNVGIVRLRPLGLLVGLLLIAEGRATTYLIRPDGTGDLPTIEAAVDATVDGDTVALADGVFNPAASIELHGKAIVIRSQSGSASSCTIVGRGGYTTVRFIHQETGTTVLEGITLTGARYEGYGGAVSCYFSPSLIIRSCVFRDNRAMAGAGIFCDESSSPLISNCLFEGNVAGADMFPGWGGGICVWGGAPLITECTLVGNMAGGSGGGIECGGSTPTISNCRIVGSIPEGIHCAGAGTRVDITDCVITGSLGSGLRSVETTVTVTGSTIAGNGSHWGAGGLHVVMGGTVRAERCVIWNNCAREGPGEVGVDGSSSAEFTCCIVDSAGVGGEGSIVGLGAESYADPMFCGPVPCESAPTDLGDYTVSEASPCALEHSPCKQQIGVLPAACPAPATHPTTWGALKWEFIRTD